MPHITLKMLKGRTDAQKDLAAERLAAALSDAIGCAQCHISVSVEDYTPEEWQTVFQQEVTDNPALRKRPDYDPKSLLP